MLGVLVPKDYHTRRARLLQTHHGRSKRKACAALQAHAPPIRPITAARREMKLRAPTASSSTSFANVGTATLQDPQVNLVISILPDDFMGDLN